MHNGATIVTDHIAALVPIELALRALLGHALGRIDACAHLKPDLLDSRAKDGRYQEWKQRYERALTESREDFIDHHRNRYASVLPVWVAVEILDWGGSMDSHRVAPKTEWPTRLD